MTEPTPLTEADVPDVVVAIATQIRLDEITGRPVEVGLSADHPGHIEVLTPGPLLPGVLLALTEHGYPNRAEMVPADAERIWLDETPVIRVFVGPRHDLVDGEHGRHCARCGLLDTGVNLMMRCEPLPRRERQPWTPPRPVILRDPADRAEGSR